MLSPFKRRSCRITREIKDLCARFQLSTCSWSMIRSLFAVTSSSIALLFVPLPHPPLFVVVLPLLLPHPSRPRPSSSFSSSSFPLSSSSSFSSSPSSSSSFLLFSSLPSSSSSVCARGAPGLGSAQVPTALPWRTRSPPEHPSRCPQGAGAGRAARCRSRSPGPRRPGWGAPDRAGAPLVGGRPQAGGGSCLGGRSQAARRGAVGAGGEIAARRGPDQRVREGVATRGGAAASGGGPAWHRVSPLGCAHRRRAVQGLGPIRGAVFLFWEWRYVCIVVSPPGLVTDGLGSRRRGLGRHGRYWWLPDRPICRLRCWYRIREPCMSRLVANRCAYGIQLVSMLLVPQMLPYFRAIGFANAASSLCFGFAASRDRYYAQPTPP
ncbi:unnamed protein product [Prorocentrum cordatum]|uniref:Solute carrier family 40 protein n=1 Tax=Prorocentrum cordatum TaxID=2364126 RepID=A0ABN9XES0_9DINO|nr:unnamed protein product [Polarella glacialis]